MKPPRHELHWLARQIILLARAKAKNIIENKGCLHRESLVEKFPILMHMYYACSFCEVFKNEFPFDVKNFCNFTCDGCPLHNQKANKNGIMHPESCCHNLYTVWNNGSHSRETKLLNAEKLYDFIYSIKIRTVIEALEKLPEDKLWKMLLKFGRAV